MTPELNADGGLRAGRPQPQRALTANGGDGYEAGIPPAIRPRGRPGDDGPNLDALGLKHEGHEDPTHTMG
jgi:hypothetical protein